MILKPKSPYKNMLGAISAHLEPSHTLVLRASMALFTKRINGFWMTPKTTCDSVSLNILFNVLTILVQSSFQIVTSAILTTTQPNARLNKIWRQLFQRQNKRVLLSLPVTNIAWSAKEASVNYLHKIAPQLPLEIQHARLWTTAWFAIILMSARNAIVLILSIGMTNARER